MHGYTGRYCAIDYRFVHGYNGRYCEIDYRYLLGYTGKYYEIWTTGLRMDTLADTAR